MIRIDTTKLIEVGTSLDRIASSSDVANHHMPNSEMGLLGEVGGPYDRARRLLYRRMDAAALACRAVAVTAQQAAADFEEIEIKTFR
jgi:hypothetical protein